MPWQKMRFRGDLVFALVDDDGKLLLDGAGRAEMKYREGDSKSYRPGPSNLTRVTGADGAGAPTGDARLGAPSSPPHAAGVAAPPRTARAISAGRTGGAGRAASSLSTSPGSGGSGQADDRVFHVWTDGACSGNPGPMGIGVVVIRNGERQEIGEYLGIGTNNIAELTAIERGLETVETHAAREPSPVEVRVYSDSGYAIGLLDKGWKAKANQELVARIRKRLVAFPGRVHFVKVPGHAGVPENERCDQLGRDAINRARATAAAR